ncbi:MAG: hypothetical protein L6R37_002165 [Teloschistes peruensis]|nr:MAG: hypothetical protein L6R37_002165 [Teloschistes peruensis]
MAENEFELTHRDRLGNHTPAGERAGVEAFNTSTEVDRSALNQLGKNPVLKRNFGFLSILGFSSTALICWESMLIVLDQGLKNGGPSGVIYGFILVWIGSLATFASLTELASMAPVAGGQYHWVSMMAPTSSQQIVSYIEGWLTVAGWQALCAGAAFLSAELLQALVSFTNPQYTPKPYQTMLLIWAVVALSVSINAQGGTDLNILKNPPQQYAFIEIFYQVTHSVSGTAVMVSFTLIMQFCATVSVQTSASRMLWSFSRDMGVPGWRQLQKAYTPHTSLLYLSYSIAAAQEELGTTLTARYLQTREARSLSGVPGICLGCSVKL